MPDRVLAVMEPQTAIGKPDQAFDPHVLSAGMIARINFGLLVARSANQRWNLFILVRQNSPMIGQSSTYARHLEVTRSLPLRVIKKYSVG